MSGAVIALFLVSVPPSQWLVARPDAISIFFVALLLAVSAGFGLLFLLSRSLPQASGGKNCPSSNDYGQLIV